ncbi:Gfo/Idh/MocA family oxidoreductase [Actinoplanes bogorensis]|uniref:Gfo/Idh/MocA family oxidoreductase n=1 Tax=Paractinoplanes bogorensis TaxID=1610840 RepID=A0ABS5Z3F6_9ACTN|nr:Gfo/Idh/MocA family oxidoreductase [Actinoplanes bogorensis]MBU2670198.1 Gfo/Idh/MocA family oxidoreductase [Actinoplanes bogorensis]
MNKARTIVFGAAHWHVPLYVEAMTEVHDVVGVSEPEADVTGLFPGVPQLSDDELLKLPDIELAYVFGPHDRMAGRCLELIERGIPFVVEKPLGTSLDELERVREAARAAGVPVTVPLVQRDAAVDRWLRKAGAPVYQRTSFIAGPPERYLRNGSPWMLDQARAGGGCLANLGPHFVDLFLTAAGERTAEVRSSLLSTLHEGKVEDHATLLLTTPGGHEAVIEVGYAFPDAPAKRYCSFTSVGRDGFAAVNSDGSATFTSTAGETEQAMLDVDSDTMYGPFVRRVAETLGDRFASMATLDDLYDAMTIIWRAYGEQP